MWLWTNVSNPWLLPLVLGMDVAAGRAVLGDAVSLPAVTGWRFWELLKAPGALFVMLLVGGLVVGAVVGVIVGGGTYASVKLLHRGRPEADANDRGKR